MLQKWATPRYTLFSMSHNHNITVPFWLDTKPVTFPPSYLALHEPNGLLAVGGDLTPEWLLLAYSKGIFPWFSPGEPIFWWTPNPRSVLFIDQINIRRSLKQTINKHLKQGNFHITFDERFEKVIKACSEIPRSHQDGTWITDEMLSAYLNLHKAGHAHSVEVWKNGQLVGGLYGVAIGKMFYGESMFSTMTDASKMALAALGLQLKQWGFSMIDAQMETDHLNSMGASNIERQEFEALLKQKCQEHFPPKKWKLDASWPEWIPGHIAQYKAKKANNPG